MTEAVAGAVTVVVGPDKVDPTIVCRSTFATPDYADTVTVATGVTGRSPEEWVRAALEQTPTGRSAPILWRSLGLRLGPRSSPDHVQGWRIGARGDDWIRIETRSAYMSGEAVVHVAAHGRLSVALFVRYDRSIAAVVWPPVSVLHRRVMPVMLGQGSRVLQHQSA